LWPPGVRRDGTTGRTRSDTATHRTRGGQPRPIGSTMFFVNIVSPVSVRSVRASVMPDEAVRVEEDASVAADHPWVVIVWNDPINLMSYVTFVLQKLFGYSLEKATELMLDVHEKGRAVVSSGTREKAEVDVFRLHEHGLWATMERDGGGEQS
jgi:ATP-dependent Clp protease adaptor protein ClpS